MELHKSIRALRLLREYSQQYMADKLNIGQNTYSKIENGKTVLNAERINHIAKILDVHPEFLISFDTHQLIENASMNFKVKQLTALAIA